MTVHKKISRRCWLGQSAGAALAGIGVPLFTSCRQASRSDTPDVSPNDSDPVPGPNDQIGVGIIGCGRRNAQLQTGRGDQGKPPAAARIVAVADLHKKRADQWAEKYQCDAYQDYRTLLDRKDVDVVIYATPEHWHYLPCIHACQAGKDIYGEQPLSHTIGEGRVMAEAVRKHQRVFQTGEQQRSHPKARQAVELILNGRIGKVHTVIGYNYPSPWECGFSGQPIPEGLDWDRWCGAGEVVPFHTDLYLSRVKYEREWLEPAEQQAIGPGWMSFRPYSGGELLNWGCHGLSMVQWALEMDASGPVEVWVEPAEPLGTLTYHEPETRQRGDAFASRNIVHYRYANDVELILSGTENRLGGGAKFVGDKGSITVYRNGYSCDPEGLDADPLPADAVRVYASDNHMQNFFDCVQSRRDPIMDIEAGHRVATLCHLGNVARWTGRRLRWDPEQEIFPGDDEANEFLDIPRRKGYELPDQV